MEASVRDFEILTHLNLYEERGNQRALPTPKVENIERVKIVPYDDARSLSLTWPEYEEQVYDF